MGSCCGLLKPAKKVTLIMVGLDNAGKTATVQSMQGESPEDVAPTLGFSKIHLSKGSFKVTILDFGGGKKNRNIWRNYYAESYGVIFVVDSSDISRMEETKQAILEVLNSPRITGKPMLVLANKQDREGALSKADIINCLSLDKIADEYKFPCQTEPCSAIMGSGEKIDKSIKKGVNWLLHTIAEDFDALNERIQRDMAEEKSYEEQQKPERAEIVRGLREDARASEEDRHVADEEDAEAVNNENPFQPLAAVICENEKEIEKDKQQQNVETEKATTLLDLQTEEEHRDAQHLPSGSNQTPTESRPETCESATTQLLQPEEGNEQTALACLPSGNRKKRNRLRLRRSHRVVPISAEATVPRHFTPAVTLPLKNWL